MNPTLKELNYSNYIKTNNGQIKVFAKRECLKVINGEVVE